MRQSVSRKHPVGRDNDILTEKRIQSEVTELTRCSFWRTDKWASRASPLVIGWRVRARSHV